MIQKYRILRSTKKGHNKMSYHAIFRIINHSKWSVELGLDSQRRQ